MNPLELELCDEGQGVDTDKILVRGKAWEKSKSVPRCTGCGERSMSNYRCPRCGVFK